MRRLTSGRPALPHPPLSMRGLCVVALAVAACCAYGVILPDANGARHLQKRSRENAAQEGLSLVRLSALPPQEKVPPVVVIAEMPPSGPRSVVQTGDTNEVPSRRWSLPHDGWSVVIIQFATIIPWTIVAFFDAIDSKMRRLRTIVWRLLASFLCNSLAYLSGTWFVAELLRDSRDGEDGRFDEISATLVALVFNIWFVLKNLRGWTQLWALQQLKPYFRRLQRNFNELQEGNKAHLVGGIDIVRVSDRLIDNNVNAKVHFVNPLIRDPHERCIALQSILWHAWWTQDTSREKRRGFEAEYYDMTLHRSAESRAPDGPRLSRHDPNTNELILAVDDTLPTPPPGQKQKIITTVAEYEAALCRYGGNESPGTWDNPNPNAGLEDPTSGQQDTRGAVRGNLLPTHNWGGIATLVHEKTQIVPHRMSSLWYKAPVWTAKLEAGRREALDSNLPFPSLPSWRRIAQSIDETLEQPRYLSGDELEVYASELAAASLLLGVYSARYKELVDMVYEDGLGARWTFGWSGLLSCFSNLWTKERIFIAMLNGLSLLAIQSANVVLTSNGQEGIKDTVRSLMVGYASFVVSDRALGNQIAGMRREELLRRYNNNKGKTCRGSGVQVIRKACAELQLPAEASHMDGLPAFMVGWDFEYKESKPGNHMPEHGINHDDIEHRCGSGNAWRYPNAFL